MANSIKVFNSFSDLKVKVAGGGGFSDGGVVCGSTPITSSTVVEIAPPKGINWGGLSLVPYSLNRAAGGVIAVNFDTVNDVTIKEYLVLEDGTEVETGDVTVTAGSIVSVTSFFAAGGVLNNPNKLRYKASAVEKGVFPTKRVLIKHTLVEFDQTVR